MKRILSINSYHYRRGGSDAVYFDHAEMMEGVGWQNGFFSMHHPKNLQTPWSKYFVNEIELGNSYSIVEKLAMTAKVIYSFEAQKRLRSLLNDFPADIAHVHCIYHHLSPSILPVLTELGIPIVMTAHDLKIACPAYKMLNDTGICERCKTGSVLNVVRHRCIRRSVAASAIVAVESGLQRTMQTYRRHLSQVIAPSRFYVEKLVEWGWPRSALAYIPNYVDSARFNPNFDPGKYFLYFGRMAPEKGVDTLIKAAARAGVQLKLAGTGPEEVALKQLAYDLGSDAEFVGVQGGHSLHALIQQARAVVLPSEWYENAPMSVLESFALGKPVIGATIGGIPELIDDLQTGWMFSSASVDDLADRLSMVRSATDSQIATMGRAAHLDVQIRFNRNRYLRSVLDLYSRLGVNNNAIKA